ncbi:MAG: hypothetical protein IJ679_11575 [Lachnospiraceae bacterium]|nr:hypothetical protein [Lachnospiraceae bacterium]
MQRKDISAGRRYGHREKREIPHDHIVLYIGIYTRNGEELVIHRPSHKTEVIYCEPIEIFMERFYKK